MTHEERLAVKRGDLVSVRLADGRLIERIVRGGPFERKAGTWVLNLQGLPRSIALSRVETILAKAEGGGQ